VNKSPSLTVAQASSPAGALAGVSILKLNDYKNRVAKRLTDGPQIQRYLRPVNLQRLSRDEPKKSRPEIEVFCLNPFTNRDKISALSVVNAELRAA